MKNSGKYSFQVLFLFAMLLHTGFTMAMDIALPVAQDISSEGSKHEISKQRTADYSFIETAEQILVTADSNFVKIKNGSGNFLNRLSFFWQKEQFKYLSDSRFIFLSLDSLKVIYPFHYFW